MIILKAILLTLFFGGVYLCSSIVPALAPSEVKNTRKQIVLLLDLTTAATVFLIASDYSNSNYLIGIIAAAATLFVLYLLKNDQRIFYLLPILAALAIMDGNYYILTCVTVTLFLKGMSDYTALKKMTWQDRRITMFVYFLLATAVALVLAWLLQAALL
jgi:hypothetical protein